VDIDIGAGKPGIAGQAVTGMDIDALHLLDLLDLRLVSPSLNDAG